MRLEKSLEQNNIDIIKQTIEHKKRIFIYGAGQYGHVVEEYIVSVLHGQIQGYIVTQCNNEYDNSDVISVNDFCNKDCLDDSIVVVAFKGEKDELICTFELVGYHNYILLSEDELKMIDAFMWEIKCNDLKTYLEQNDNKDISFDFSNEYVEKAHAVITHKTTKEPLYRVSLCVERDSVLQGIRENCNNESFRNIYGSMVYLGGRQLDIGVEALDEESIDIYSVTSIGNRNKKISVKQRSLKPIFVGDCNGDVAEIIIKDCVGDNISNRNKDYSEATALYWLWKNTSNQKYIGICHYRRLFSYTNQLHNSLCNSLFDVIITLPQFTQLEVKSFFTRLVSDKDWDLLKKYTIEINPDYKDIFEEYENSNFYIPCNMAIMKRNWFEQYCSFAFSITDKIYNYYSERNIIRHDRYMGYLFESLLSLFIAKNKEILKIGYTDMIFIDD